MYPRPTEIGANDSSDFAFPAPLLLTLSARPVSLHLDRPAHPSFEGHHGIVEQHRHERRHQTPLQDEGRVIGQKARDDHLAQALRGDRRPDGGGADIDNQREANSFKNRPYSERKFNSH